MNLTNEQKQVITQLQGPANIKAFAGTGKTTTLIELAKKNPQTRFLYLAFNKSVQTQAQKKFPKNVVCKTIHSIAYGEVGKNYRSKLGNNRLFTINALTQDYRMAYFAQSTVKNFLNSAAPEITEKHINKHEVMTPGEIDYKRCLEYANQIWEKMQAPEDEFIKMEHDGYLKLWQLRQTPFPVPCDYILFDEAQDSNNVVYAALTAAQIPVVAVGDHHQAIYAFRGAINSLKKFQGTNFHLTQSFRFGDEVAGLANMLLQRFKDERLEIRGTGAPDKVDWTAAPVAAAERTMKISRSNSGLIDAAIECLHQNAPFHIVGGVNEDLFKITKSVAGAKFHREDMIRDQVIKHFYNHGRDVMENIKEYAEKTNDKEIERALANCEKYGEEIFQLLEKIKEQNGPVRLPFWLAHSP